VRSKDGSDAAAWAARFGHAELATTLAARSAAVVATGAKTAAAEAMAAYQRQTNADEVRALDHTHTHTHAPTSLCALPPLSPTAARAGKGLERGGLKAPHCTSPGRSISAAGVLLGDSKAEAARED
jgi:hypothetical protein